MPRVEGEDAFMASLLADLDADVFTSPPASQALPSRPPSQSHSRGPSQRPRPLKRSAPSSSQPRPQPLTPRKRAARPTAAAEPEPFWADPLARPLMSQGALARRDEAERAGGFVPGVERERGVVKKARRATEQGCGAGGEGTGEVRRVKRVEIGLEGKENTERERRDRSGVVEVKREELVNEKERDVKPVVDVALGIFGVKASAEGDEFDYLLGGVDWDEAMIGFDDEQAVETSVSFQAFSSCSRLAGAHLSLLRALTCRGASSTRDAPSRRSSTAWARRAGRRRCAFLCLKLRLYGN